MTFKKRNKIDKIPKDIQKNGSKLTRFLRTFRKTDQN